MNYADMALGTWYPMGGMGRLVDAMMHVAKEQGVDDQRYLELCEAGVVYEHMAQGHPYAEAVGLSS